MAEHTPLHLVEQLKSSEFAAIRNEFKEFADTFFPYGIPSGQELVVKHPSSLEPEEVEEKLQEAHSPFKGLVHSPEEVFPKIFAGGVDSTAVRLQITASNWDPIAHIDAGWQRKVGIHFKYINGKHKVIQRLSMIVNSKNQHEPPRLRRMITRETQGALKYDEPLCMTEDNARHFLELVHEMKKERSYR